MEKKLIYLLATTFIFFIQMMTVVPCSSEVVWSEDFNDGDMDGWTVTQGNFTVENGYLESIVNEKYLEDFYLLSCCFTQSTVSVGTWSFEIMFDCSSEYPEIAVEFMTKKQTRWSRGMSPLGEVYGIYAGWEYPNIYELYTAPYFPSSTKIEMYPTVPGTKRKVWHHIDITRDEEGRIQVYFDGVLGINEVDTRLTESYYFGVMLDYHHIGKTYIDNIVVSDTIDVQPTEEAAKKGGSIPGFPIESVIIGLIGVTIIIWSIQRTNHIELISKIDK